MFFFLLGCGCCMSENKNLDICVYLNGDFVWEWLLIMLESIGLFILVFFIKELFYFFGNLLIDG